MGDVEVLPREVQSPALRAGRRGVPVRERAQSTVGERVWLGLGKYDIEALEWALHELLCSVRADSGSTERRK